MVKEQRSHIHKLLAEKTLEIELNMKKSSQMIDNTDEYGGNRSKVDLNIIEELKNRRRDARMQGEELE